MASTLFLLNRTRRNNDNNRIPSFGETDRRPTESQTPWPRPHRHRPRRHSLPEATVGSGRFHRLWWPTGVAVPEAYDTPSSREAQFAVRCFCRDRTRTSGRSPRGTGPHRSSW